MILNFLAFFLSFSQSFTMKGSTSHDDFKFKVSPVGNEAVGLVGQTPYILIPVTVVPCLQP